jgi:hypothetical protein
LLTEIALGDFSELQPDPMLLRPRPDFYAQAHPGAQDVLLLVEVADNTLTYDRARKISRYGQHGVTASWLINLPKRVIEVYTNPNPQGCADRHIARIAETLEPLPGLAMELDLLFSHCQPLNVDLVFLDQPINRDPGHAELSGRLGEVVPGTI